METVGRLAGGVAHDFNNHLTAIGGYADLLEAQLPAEARSREDLVEIRKAVNRAAALTSQLLAFSRRSILQPTVIEPDAVIADLSPMLRRLLGERIRTSVIRSPQPLLVRVDRSRLEQVVLNLAVNARDAMPDGGLLTIETSLVELDEGYASTHREVIPGRYAMLAVTDTGTGMPPDVLAHVFEPFYTTKVLGLGTGLGLSTVDGVVRQSGGSVSVHSEPGSGTVFKVYLPMVAGSAEPDAPAPSEPTLLNGTERILLVEDDETVREMAAVILRRHGYAVSETSSGEEALAVAAELDHIDLLVTDVVLTGISGRVVADRLAEVHPSAAVLCVSGYTENAIVHHGVLDAGIDFLPKPFRTVDLARAVRRALDRRER